MSPYRKPGKDAPLLASELKKISLREKEARNERRANEAAGPLLSLEEVLKKCRIMARVTGGALFPAARISTSVRAELESMGFVLKEKRDLLHIIWCDETT